MILFGVFLFILFIFIVGVTVWLCFLFGRRKKFRFKAPSKEWLDRHAAAEDEIRSLPLINPGMAQANEDLIAEINEAVDSIEANRKARREEALRDCLAITLPGPVNDPMAELGPNWRLVHNTVTDKYYPQFEAEPYGTKEWYYLDIEYRSGEMPIRRCGWGTHGQSGSVYGRTPREAVEAVRKFLNFTKPRVLSREDWGKEIVQTWWDFWDPRTQQFRNGWQNLCKIRPEPQIESMPENLRFYGETTIDAHTVRIHGADPDQCLAILAKSVASHILEPRR